MIHSTSIDPLPATVPWLTGRGASAGAARSRRPHNRPRHRPRRPSRSRRAGVTSRLPVVPWLVAGAIAVVALIAILVVFKPGTGTGGAAASASPGPSGSRGRRPRARVAGDCPTSQPPALPAGETRTVTLNTPKGAIAIKVEADLSPIAAGNFVALASCGFYDGTVFHRTADTPGRHAVRHPGRRSRGHRDGRTRLHHQGRAGHDAVQARHRGHGPDRAPRTASARSSSSSSTTRTATS